MTQPKTTGTPSFQVWCGGGYELAEGTRWPGDHLVFTDILAGTLLAATARFWIPDPAPRDGAILHARVGASAPSAASFSLLS